MKRTLVILLLALASCGTKPPKASDEFSKWLIIDKVDMEPAGCMYYWNRGKSAFLDSCSKYNVGDTIVHQ